MKGTTATNPDVIRLYKALSNELTDTMARVGRAQSRIEEIETFVFDTVLTELKEKKISAYNASIAYANLINSACKLQRLKLEILDRLTGHPRVENTPESCDEGTKESDRELRRFAEKLLVQMATNSLSKSSSVSPRD